MVVPGFVVVLVVEDVDVVEVLVIFGGLGEQSNLGNEIPFCVTVKGDVFNLASMPPGVVASQD